MTAKERFRRMYERFALKQAFKTGRFCGNTAGARERAQKTFNDHRSLDNNTLANAIAKTLKEGAGWGSCAMTADNVSFWSWHDTNGLKLQVGKCRPQNGAHGHTYEFKYKWQQVARMALERGVFDEAR